MTVSNSICMRKKYGARTNYCIFRNFREKFIFANIIKRHICDDQNLRLGHDFPTYVNDRMISPFREGLIFMKLRIREVS